MQRWKAILRPGSLRMTEPEYHASMNGLNIFFGAILGVGLAGVENLDPLPYMILLFMAAGLVIAILYIAASRHRIGYAAALVVLLTTFLLTHDKGDLLFGSIPVPAKLVPTLIVWAATTIVVEFSPREQALQTRG